MTLGSVRAAARKYPDLHIIHLDAHTDLREDYLGVRLSHACVIRRCWEILGNGRIHQFGIRSGEKDEFEWAKSGHTNMNPFDLEGLAVTVESLQENRFILRWIWMCWTRRYFREQGLRSQEELII